MFHSPKDVSSPLSRAPHIPGRRSLKEATFNADSTTSTLTGRPRLLESADDANQSTVPPTSRSVLIAPPSNNPTGFPMSLTTAIKQEARRLGFDAVGITRLANTDRSPAPHEKQSSTSSPSETSISPHLLTRLMQWLEHGYHGTMAWMERTPEKRADPRLVLPECRSVISLGINYLTKHQAKEQPGYGRIARYAWGKDYHKVFESRLTQLEQSIHQMAPEGRTRSYADTGPLMEKAWAERAGLGWIGKHSNLVSAEHGSWLLLGEILTTLELEPDEPATDLCGSCTLCIQACPTKAIVEPYAVDATRCISYLTIEWRGDQSTIPHELQTGMGNKIFGCDDCLDVCPFNLRAEPTEEPAFQPSDVALAPNLQELAGMDETTFRTTFQQSPVRRAKHNGWLRNVSIARQNMKP